ncbi:MAG: hypothetical protein RR250_03625 [Akkermansia sp.]
MKKILTLLFSFLYLLAPWIPAEEANPQHQIIELTPDDSILGEWLNDPTQGKILIQSPLITGKSRFNIKGLRSITLNNTLKRERGTSITKLVNGDIIRGALTKTTNDSIILSTSWCHNLHIPKAFIKELGFEQNKNIIFSGDGSLTLWSYPRTNNSWISNELGLTCLSSQDEITRDMQLPESIHLSLTIIAPSKNIVPMHIKLWCSPPGSSVKNDYFDFYMFAHIARVMLVNKGIEYNLGSPLLEQAMEARKRKTTNSSRIDLFANRNTGVFYLYIDGQLNGEWNINALMAEQEEEGKPTDNPLPHLVCGSGFSFGFLNNIPGSISDLNIYSWNGHPLGQSLPLPFVEGENPSSSHKTGEDIYLINGDKLTGNLSLDSPDSITVKSPLYQVSIPMDKIIRLGLKKQDSSPCDLKDTTNIKIILTDGSCISGTYKMLNDNHLNIRTKIMGDLSIPKEEIKKVLFILNKKPELQ